MEIDHIALSVSNIARSASFYGKHFGLKRSEKYRHQEAGLSIAILKKGNICLELFEFKKHKVLPKYRKTIDSDLRTVGVKHFSFKVVDIEGAFKRLKKASVPCATDLRVFDNGRRYFFIKDPDGNLLELMEA